MGLTIDITEKEPKVFLAMLKGEINTETYQLLEDQLKDTIVKAQAIILDMAEVSYVSSMGLSAIFRIKLALEEKKGTVALVNIQPQVQLVFETMKVISEQMFASLQEADEYLDSFLDGVQKGKIKPHLPQQ
jgi:anti-anti-sigma factor